MALIDLAQLEPTMEPEALLSLSAATEELRLKVTENGPWLDDIGRELLEHLLTVAADTEQRITEQHERIRYLEGLSITDELTGLLNRRGFHLEMERALARAERNDECGVLLLCDLNRFKAVNDTYGHLAGDAVLHAVAQLLCRRTRRSDYVGRLGGDEFAVLMTNTKPRQAQARAQSLVGWVNRLRVDWEDKLIPVSMACGMEIYDHTSDAERLFALADRALYRDKKPRKLQVA